MAAKCRAVAPDPSTLATGGCYVSRNGRSVMTPPVAGTYGTMGRNIFRDPGIMNVDFSVFKNFTFKERYNAQFRVEFFNLFNHPILANPYGGVVNSALGNDPSVPQTFGCGCAHARRRQRQSDSRIGKRPRDATRVQVHVLVTPA